MAAGESRVEKSSEEVETHKSNPGRQWTLPAVLIKLFLF